MKWIAISLAFLLTSTTLTDAKRCKKVVHTCKNGITKVYPNPENDCKFDLCPEDMNENEKLDEIEIKNIPTNPPNTKTNEIIEWKALDSTSIPDMMRDAAKNAFDLYKEKSICDELTIEYKSIERKNTSDFIGTKNKNSNYNKIPTESYHIITKLKCYLNGINQINGNFILNMEHHGKNKIKYYKLIECGHEEEWNQIVNWLTIKNGHVYCDTPKGRAIFNTQPLHFINSQSSDSMSFINIIKKDTKYIAITGILIGILSVFIIVFIVFIIKKKNKKKKWFKQSIPMKPISKRNSNDDITIENEINSTRGLVDGISTKNNLAEIKI